MLEMWVILPVRSFAFLMRFYRVPAIGASKLKISFGNRKVHSLRHLAQCQREINTNKAFGETGHLITLQWD